MEIFFEFSTWVALLTLIFLEVVLGIDNIIFISLVSAKLPAKQQAKARSIGLILALVMRILLLMGISYIVKLTNPLFSIHLFDFKHDISIRDLILLAGGFFLLAKSTSEIHHKVSEDFNEHENTSVKAVSGLGKVIFQIVLLDLVFSFDSILTAIGLSDQILLMVIAVMVSIVIMLIFSGKISNFINDNPTLQILALSFLILIGVMLVVDAFHYEIPKGYIYFSVAFSLIVEFINMKIRKK